MEDQKHAIETLRKDSGNSLYVRFYAMHEKEENVDRTALLEGIELVKHVLARLEIETYANTGGDIRLAVAEIDSGMSYKFMLALRDAAKEAGVEVVEPGRFASVFESLETSLISLGAASLVEQRKISAQRQREEDIGGLEDLFFK